jgi:hypothetical protein
MKIFRRKKNGHEVGTFYVRQKGGGRPISLALDGAPCTDAREANRRAKLALKGKWPPSAVAAAKVASRAEHVPEDDTEYGGGGLADPPVPSPSAPPMPDPSPETQGGAETGDEPNPAAAAAAAAADAAGPADAGAVPEDEESRRRAWAEDFVRRHGGMLAGLPAGISPGAVCAFAQTMGLAKGAAILGGRADPPIYVVLKPDSFASLMPPLADAWEEQLRRWGIAFGKVEPWYVILGSAIAAASTIVMGMTKTPPAPPEGQPGAPS